QDAIDNAQRTAPINATWQDIVVNSLWQICQKAGRYRHAPTMTIRPLLLNAATKSATFSFVEDFMALHPVGLCHRRARPRSLAPGRLRRRVRPSSGSHRRGWGRT